MTQRREVSKCWKTGANKLALGWVATNLQFVKSALSVKGNKAKQ